MFDVLIVKVFMKYRCFVRMIFSKIKIIKEREESLPFALLIKKKLSFFY